MHRHVPEPSLLRGSRNPTQLGTPSAATTPPLRISAGNTSEEFAWAPSVLFVLFCGDRMQPLRVCPSVALCLSVSAGNPSANGCSVTLPLPAQGVLRPLHGHVPGPSAVERFAKSRSIGTQSAATPPSLSISAGNTSEEFALGPSVLFVLFCGNRMQPLRVCPSVALCLGVSAGNPSANGCSVTLPPPAQGILRPLHRHVPAPSAVERFAKTRSIGTPSADTLPSARISAGNLLRSLPGSLLCSLCSFVAKRFFLCVLRLLICPPR